MSTKLTAEALWQTPRVEMERTFNQLALTAKGRWMLSQLGGLVYDPTSRKAFVGDADSKNPRVRVMDVSGNAPVELAPIATDPEKGLLPRYLGLY